MIGQVNPQSSEYALWFAVIDKALSDLKSKDNYERNAAYCWFFDYSPDFEFVCSLVNLDPNYIRKIAQNLQEMLSHRKPKKRKVAPSSDIDKIITDLAASEVPKAQALKRALEYYAWKIQKKEGKMTDYNFIESTEYESPKSRMYQGFYAGGKYFILLGIVDNKLYWSLEDFGGFLDLFFEIIKHIEAKHKDRAIVFPINDSGIHYLAPFVDTKTCAEIACEFAESEKFSEFAEFLKKALEFEAFQHLESDKKISDLIENALNEDIQPQEIMKLIGEIN